MIKISLSRDKSCNCCNRGVIDEIDKKSLNYPYEEVWDVNFGNSAVVRLCEECIEEAIIELSTISEMTNCNVCNKKVGEEAWLCEKCGNEHHPDCSGESFEGHGEYAFEEAYSICKSCCNKRTTQKEPKEKKT